MSGRSWSFAHDRRVIELAKASKSLEEAARIMKRKPERIRKVAMRLGVSFKIEKNELPAAPPQLSNGGRYAGAAWHRKFFGKFVYYVESGHTPARKAGPLWAQAGDVDGDNSARHPHSQHRHSISSMVTNWPPCCCHRD